jgi:hypothetical protein
VCICPVVTGNCLSALLVLAVTKTADWSASQQERHGTEHKLGLALTVKLTEMCTVHCAQNVYQFHLRLLSEMFLALFSVL